MYVKVEIYKLILIFVKNMAEGRKYFMRVPLEFESEKPGKLLCWHSWKKFNFRGFGICQKRCTKCGKVTDHYPGM